MTLKQSLRFAMYAGVAALTLVACADTDIVSPGTPPGATPPATPPPPTPPPTASINLVPAAGCPDGTDEMTLPESGALSDVDVCTLSGTLLSDVTIPGDLTVAIQGPTFIGMDGGASVTLTIQPGATLFGSAGGDFLSVSRGSQIEAVGTDTNPIIFTARQDINDDALGTNLAVDTLRGQWGGLVLNGFAPINACDDATATGGTAECEASGEGGTGTFGGDQPTDSSGTLQFVQVRFAGFEITAQNELNGIAFQGVGSGTTVDSIQVFNNADDGIEFFGGTVNARFVALNGNADDSLDWTDGWTGNVQFLLIDHALEDADQGIEADNNGDDNLAQPRSNPTISNATIVGREGGDSDIGILLREGTAATVVNGIVTGGFADGAFDVDDAESFARIGAAGGEDIVLASFILDDDVPFIEEVGDPVDLSDTFGPAQNVSTDNATLQAEFFPGAAEQAVTVFDTATLGAFFDPADVIGAFRLTDTPEDNWATGWTTGIVQDAVIECPAGTDDVSTTIPIASNADAVVCELPPVIVSDTTLPAGPFYAITGPTFIGEDAGADPANPTPGAASASLTIDGGAVLFGAAGSDFLAVNRGSQLFSNGVSTNPVIFTSLQDLEGNAGPTARGQWGGLVLNGRAPINACDNAVATGGTVGCEASGEGGTGTFGGATSDDDSGNLFFTQVRFAGFEITNNNELNGIAFQGVGSGTNVDSIQVHNNADDGIEFFGGTVNVSRVLLTGNDDDSIDWTDGWVGSLQFGLVQQASTNGDQGIEADNNGDDNLAEPVSNPTLSNITLISQNRDIGVLLREGTSATLVNTIIVGFEDGGVDIDDGASFNNIAGGPAGLAEPLRIESLFLDNIGPNFLEETGDPVDLSDTFTMNVTQGTSDLAGTTFITGAPGIIPGPNITAVTALDPTTLGLAPGAFLGAVEDADDDAFTGWTFSE